MLQKLLKKLSNGLGSFIKFLAPMWVMPKSALIGFPFINGSSTNQDPEFYRKEMNFHEEVIMEINDEITALEEERAKHEYFYNISNTMYSNLIQKT